MTTDPRDGRTATVGTGIPGAGRAHLPSWALRLGLPVGVSLAIHAGLLCVLVGVAWTVRTPVTEDQLGSEFVITVPPRPFELPSDPPRAPAEAEAMPRVAEPPPVLSGLVTGDGPGPALRSGIPDADVTTILRRAEVPPPTATFAGLGARKAQSVVYAVDASGAMVTNLKWVLQEVERSILALAPGQSFQVVLFRDRSQFAGVSAEVFRADSGPSRLVPATASNKSAVAAWLASVQPAGRSNPLDGLRRALALQPDVVFLLSRGIPRTEGEEFPGDWSRGPRAILEELDTLNPAVGGRRRVVIKTIQFLEDDPTGTMQAVAAEHGDGPGSYAVLTLDQLRGPRR
jgi:hypothetical protein